MMRGAIALGQVAVVEDADDRLRIEAVVYDEAADRSEPVGLSTEALAKTAMSFVGLPVLDRRHEVEERPGEVIGRVVESRLEGTQIIQVQEWWNPTAIREVREGVRQGFSISWDPTSANELIEADGRLLYTDVVPLEVTRTYAPVVHGTGIRAVLRRLRRMDAGKVRETLDSLASDLGVEVPELLAMLARADNGDDEETESAPAAEEPETEAAPAEAAAFAKRADDAVDLRVAKLERMVATLRTQNNELVAKQTRDAKRQALRQYRRAGYLKGSVEQLETALESVSVEALSQVLAHVTPGEPMLPGEVLTDAAGPAEAEVSEIRNPTDIHATALRLAEKTGREYADVRREIINSLTGRGAR